MFRSRVSKAGISSLAIVGAALTWSVPAEAGASTGTWRNGMVAGAYGSGYYGGYRPAGGGYYGGYGPGYPGYAYRPHYHRHNYGGAVAAGAIGGLALGALATAPYRYPYPAYGGGYSGATVYDDAGCYTVKKRYVDEWGRLIIRRTQICE